MLQDTKGSVRSDNRDSRAGNSMGAAVSAVQNVKQTRNVRKARVTIETPIPNSDDEPDHDVYKHVTLTRPQMSLADPTDHAVVKRSQQGPYRAEMTMSDIASTSAKQGASGTNYKQGRATQPSRNDTVRSDVPSSRTQVKDVRTERTDKDGRRLDSSKTESQNDDRKRGTPIKLKPLRRSSASLTRVVRV